MNTNCAQPGPDGLSIEDERAIAAVLVRYATAVDRREWSLFKTCFMDDFVGDYGELKRWSGADEITKYMIDVHVPFGLTLHRITNIVVEASAGGAVARSYVDAILMPRESGGPGRHAAGFYDDEFVKDRNEWRIKKRKFTPVRIVYEESMK